MTAPDTSLDAPAPSASVRPSISTIIAFAGGVSLLLLHGIVRVAGASLASAGDTTQDVAMVVGIIGLVSVVPILVNIALAHVGIFASKRGTKSGRTLAVAAATIGYVLLALYVNRLVVVLVAITTQGLGFGDFAPNFFWWS